MRKHLLLIQKYVLEQSFVQIPFSKVLEIRGFYELGNCVIIMQWNSQIPFWKVSASITIKTTNFNHLPIYNFLPLWSASLSHRMNWYTVVRWSIKTFPFAKANTAWNCILGIQMSKSFLFHFENSLKDRFRQKFVKRDFAIVWEVGSNQKWLFTHPTSFVSAYHWSIFNHPSNKAIFAFKIFMAILLALIMKSRAL